MRNKIALLFAILVWFAVIAQLVLMINNRKAPIGETIIRFFTFFTILTNIIVAVYLTAQSFRSKRFTAPGTLTAVTVYITIVGLVYQVILRPLWSPTGLQKIVDELLHTINPLLIILFWYLFEEKRKVKYWQIIGWLLYPVVYVIYVFIRGNISGFYPYPFINVPEIGFAKAATNSLFLFLFFIAASFIYILIGHLISGRVKTR
ncbi:MAG: Pr6Pr family membrane protein [Chitinophagaceae bacterium]